MATKFDATLLPSNTTDANFRAWCSFIRDLLVTVGGWVQTADTGQMNFTTVTTPSVANTKQGYIIVRMADALQATSPVFLRIDFGSGGNALTQGIWLTIGTGSDGAGNITTKRFDGGSVTTPTITPGTNTTGTVNAYGSAAPNRVHFGLNIRSSPCILFLSIERSKDTTGADTGDGLLLYYNTSTLVNVQRYVVMGAAGQPVAENGLQYVLSSNNPSVFGSDVGVAVPIPVKGCAQPPGYGVAMVRSSDFAIEGSFQVVVYTTTVTYQHLNGVTVFTALVAANDAATRVAMRYD